MGDNPVEVRFLSRALYGFSAVITKRHEWCFSRVFEVLTLYRVTRDAFEASAISPNRKFDIGRVTLLPNRAKHAARLQTDSPGG